MKNKVVLITGATGGIGSALIKICKEKGATVIVTSRGTQYQGMEPYFQIDVTDEEQVRTAIEEIIRRYGKIDIVINNAGYGMFLPFQDSEVDALERMMDVNFFGTLRCTKAVLPYMKKAGSGHIINIASIVGKIGTAYASGYAATKYAVVGFSDCLRQEVRGTGITVSVLCPGPVDTAFFDRADPRGGYLKSIKPFMIHTDDVASAVYRIIKSGKREKIIPWSFWLLTKLYPLFPNVIDDINYRLIGRRVYRHED